MRYAGFWVRFWAALIDSICLLPVYFLQAILDGMDFYGYSFMFTLILCCSYYAFFESSIWQATPGKKLFGLKVIDVSGRRISIQKAVGRYFGKLLSSLIFGIGYIMVGITDRKQGLHDKLVDTFVIYSSSDLTLSDQKINQSNTLNNSDQFVADTQNSVSKYVMAGFDTSGHVIRLTFDVSDPSLVGKGILVGRNSDSCDLQINDPSVSRTHARFYTVSGDLFIEDLGSTNGVFVDGKRCQSSSVVFEDSRISFGDVELTIGKY
jgi:uncharacterized RDD family membrane protein YckC